MKNNVFRLLGSYAQIQWNYVLKCRITFFVIIMQVISSAIFDSKQSPQHMIPKLTFKGSVQKFTKKEHNSFMTTCSLR